MLLALYSPEKAHPMVKAPIKMQPVYEPEFQKKKPPYWLLVLIVGIAGVLVFNMAKPKEFAYRDEQGNTVINPSREAELQKGIDELDNAEQYVLLATVNGWYACYSCLDTIAIFLLAGEVWKYGVTRKGEKGRYGTSLDSKNLAFHVQFRGVYGDCLKEERRKIFYYPKLPESVKRAKLLIRPPGNKRDD